MGTGTSGNYHGTHGGSQEYSETYHVVATEMTKDKKDPDIYNPASGYFKNPTATAIEDAVNNNRIFIDDKRQDGMLTYVMDANGKIIIGKRFNPNDISKRSPHPTLIGGKDPVVQCAGMITFNKGRISSVNTNSGHYRPNEKSLPAVKDALQKICDKNPDLFDPKSEWRKKK